MELHRLSDRWDLIDQVASLLAEEWPAQSYASRRAALHSSVQRDTRGLPCHLCLVGADGIVLAACRIQQACENTDGFSAAVTSVVVKPSARRRGLGRKLLTEAHMVAASLGYGYMYLWTHDQQAFYAACGYQECVKVSLLAPAFALLGQGALQKLESLFAAKAAKAQNDSAEAVAREDSTWMRKRLLESGAKSVRTPAEMRTLVQDALAGLPTSSESSWALLLTGPVEWERQIGPCCGIAALRMARSSLRRHNGECRSMDLGNAVECRVELRLAGVGGVPDASLLQAGAAPPATACLPLELAICCTRTHAHRTLIHRRRSPGASPPTARSSTCLTWPSSPRRCAPPAPAPQLLPAIPTQPPSLSHQGARATLWGVTRATALIYSWGLALHYLPLPIPTVLRTPNNLQHAGVLDSSAYP